MRGISKQFSVTTALADVDFEIARPMIHGLVGQNGAGKSTLLKILAGDYRPSAGTISVDGREVDISSPRRAHELGIGIVYQEFSLFGNLTVAQNISLGHEPTNGTRIDEARLLVDAREALARIGGEGVDPTAKVAELPLSERQLVEIAKVLVLRRPRILIFDEPTAALGQADVARLFGTMTALREEAVTIIFVSHRYREVLDFCERITVLRNGRVAADLDRADANLERLVDLTLGQKAEAAFSRQSRREVDGDVLIEAVDVRVGTKLRGASVTVRRGEIVGLCGLLGSGQNELARALGETRRSPAARFSPTAAGFACNRRVRPSGTASR